MAQPTHFCGWASSACAQMSPRNCGREIRSAPGVQSLTQIEQALQAFAFIAGFGHSARFMGAHFFPAPSTTAPLAQTLPQTPQPTQRFSFTICRESFDPETANTGQSFAQTVQPVQTSLMLYDIFPS